MELSKEQIDAVAEWMLTNGWGISGLKEVMPEVANRFVKEFSPKNKSFVERLNEEKEKQMKDQFIDVVMQGSPIEKPKVYILQKDLPDAKSGDVFLKNAYEGDMSRLLPNEYYYKNTSN